MNALLQARGWDLLGAAVRLHAVGERSAATDRLVEPAMGLAVAVGVTLDDVDVEVVAHLLTNPTSSPANLRPAQASAFRWAAR